MSIIVFGSELQYRMIGNFSPAFRVFHGWTTNCDPKLVVIFSGEMDDREILGKVVSQWPAVPIVMVTERVDQEHFMMALKWGIKEYVIGELDQERWNTMLINLNVVRRS